MANDIIIIDPQSGAQLSMEEAGLVPVNEFDDDDGEVGAVRVRRAGDRSDPRDSRGARGARVRGRGGWGGGGGGPAVVVVGGGGSRARAPEPDTRATTGGVNIMTRGAGGGNTQFPAFGRVWQGFGDTIPGNGSRTYEVKFTRKVIAITFRAKGDNRTLFTIESVKAKGTDLLEGEGTNVAFYDGDDDDIPTVFEPVPVESSSEIKVTIRNTDPAPQLFRGALYVEPQEARGACVPHDSPNRNNTLARTVVVGAR